MKSTLRSILQYIGMIVLTALLLWLSLRGLTLGEGENKSDFLWKAWQNSNKGYLGLMALVAILSHLLRAERWRMFLVPTGNKVGLTNSFLSLMIGYLVNLAVPRGGEVSRCYNLYKLEKTPVEVSFGTVVVERMVDVVCLLLLIALSFFAEWQKLKKFIDTLNFSYGEGFSISPWMIVVFLGVIVFAAAIFFLRKNKKLLKIIEGFKEGLLAIFKMQNKGLFIAYSLGIWLLYFLMSYLVIKAFPETEDLGFSAVLTLFAVGSIAMAAPLPGGAGSYHTLVPLALVMLYNLPQADAVAFVFIFHGWQTILMILMGVLSLIASYLIIKWRKQKEK
ncbi:MAG: flippase-like domain-containing protein [Cytophagales bacterium]|nr:flippase-like domain-containing protein [Cytophagales bacterium]MCA6388855.1 flippase-like domain-containing protein [Cytophagales bacterium]MCA6391085.1 flippase-like domain-containing protein [Cytophagales bacterium]MCA6393900.1 flippase-like domain-containing protein [Cytophagales bacterium]MCA6397770.1 flippase-like domain-containing protein [Cytophagales bacterium]